MIQVELNSIGYFQPHRPPEAKAPMVDTGLYDLSNGGKVAACIKKRVLTGILSCYCIGEWGNYLISTPDNKLGVSIKDIATVGEQFEMQVMLPIEVTAEGMLSHDWAPLVLRETAK